MEIAKRRAKRVGVAIVGGLVVVVGIVAIPYPGPGWLIVFAGLAILATEFEWAQRILDHARGKYDQWQEWLKKQNLVIRLSILIATGLIVITTMWLLNVLSFVNLIFHSNVTWLNSPLGLFSN
jgi:uncharacterized protein (TIGR02611 family)